MSHLSIIAFTRQGCRTGQQLLKALSDVTQVTLSVPARFAEEFQAQPYEKLSAWVADHFDGGGIVFVSPCSIAVRAIAPLVHGQFSSPAVVSVDELGRFAVPLLSGEGGGGNTLARRVAAITGGEAVISAAADADSLFAVDRWAAEQGMAVGDPPLAKELTARLLENLPVGYESDMPIAGPLPHGVTAGGGEAGFSVSLDGEKSPFQKTLHLIPRILVLGVGCRRHAEDAVVEGAIQRVLARHHFSPKAVALLVSIDLRQDEHAFHILSRKYDWPMKFYYADQLMEVEGSFVPSDSAELARTFAGVDNVCERSVLRSGCRLLVPKVVEDGVAIAIGALPFSPAFPGEEA